MKSNLTKVSKNPKKIDEHFAQSEVLSNKIPDKLPPNLIVGRDVNIWPTQNFLPPPALLEEYNRIDPNLSRDIISEWKLEGENRRSIEQRDSISEIAGRIRGQYLSFIFSLILVSSAFYLAVQGQVAIPIAIITGNIALVAGNLLWQRLSRR
ncbi:MAG: DUF2335 domain-containing protein [Candidatus Pacebacteria bacterium]|nr:DUF2335 domain-containing protein [Candidatus Paceibacterota bacterium]